MTSVTARKEFVGKSVTTPSSATTTTTTITVTVDAIVEGLTLFSSSSSSSLNVTDEAGDDDDHPTGALTAVDIVQAVAVCVISAGIIASNLVNLVVLGRCLHIPRVTRAFLWSLSFSDLLVGIIACAPAAVPAFTGRWPFGAAWCQVSGIAHGASVTISIWSMSMVGVDRYVAVVEPMRYRKIISIRKCYAIIGCLWTAAVMTFAAPLLTRPGLVYYRYSRATRLCGLQWDYPAYCVITGAYIPVPSAVVLVFAARTSSAARRRETRSFCTVTTSVPPAYRATSR